MPSEEFGLLSLVFEGACALHHKDDRPGRTQTKRLSPSREFPRPPDAKKKDRQAMLREWQEPRTKKPLGGRPGPQPDRRGKEKRRRTKQRKANALSAKKERKTRDPKKSLRSQEPIHALSHPQDQQTNISPEVLYFFRPCWSSSGLIRLNVSLFSFLLLSRLGLPLFRRVFSVLARMSLSRG